MRIFCFLFILSIIICCNPAEEKLGFPKEYLYPHDKIGSGKTFVYKKVGPEDQLNFFDIKIITESEKKYILTKQYNSLEVFDSSKSDIDNKLIESYTLFPFCKLMVKGEIKEDSTVLSNGVKFGKATFKIIYSDSNNLVSINKEREYLKDTIIIWQGKEVKCIVSQTKSSLKYKNFLHPSSNTNVEASGFAYHGFGIGLIRYTNAISSGIKSTFSMTELVEIKDLK